MPSDPTAVILPKTTLKELLFVARNSNKSLLLANYSGKPAFDVAAAELGIPPADIQRMLDVFVNLQRILSRYGWQPDALLDGAIPANFERTLEKNEKTEALHLWSEARPAIAEALRRINANHPLALITRAEQLAYVQEKLYSHARIVTQIRPLFDELGNEILRAIVSHELVIDYFEGQNPRRIQIALDAADISELKGACERADRKAASVKDALRDKPWETSVLAESDDAPPTQAKDGGNPNAAG
ncbi:MAG TPA: hypothetical protein VK395_27595 [Gemmataceae bacterium]|nr:hypothetical protein [Gemmataceae bacterium]